MNATSAFDASVYDLPIPKVDGIKADKLSISVTGDIKLDRTDATDLNLVNGFQLGETYELRVQVVCVGKAPTFTPSKDEDEPGSMTHRTVLKVTTIQ